MTVPRAGHEEVGANQQHDRQPAGLSHVIHKMWSVIWRQTGRLPIRDLCERELLDAPAAQTVPPSHAVLASAWLWTVPRCSSVPLEHIFKLDECRHCAILPLSELILANGCNQIQFSR